MFIHPTAIVAQGACLEEGVFVGPYSCVGSRVTLKKGVRLTAHVIVDGWTTLGEGTEVFSFASVGNPPQHMAYKGEETALIIGKQCKIRENVTIHTGTLQGEKVTTLGDHCLVMSGCHIAHDCRLGNHVVLASNVILGGHVHIEDKAFVGGLTAVHQFVRIGEGAMVAGASALAGDVIPFALAQGNRANLEGLNVRGLRRQGVSNEEIRTLQNFFFFLFQNETVPLAEKIRSFPENLLAFPSVEKIRNFLHNLAKRPLCLPKEHFFLRFASAEQMADWEERE